MSEVVEVNIDVKHLSNIAQTGVRRATLFMGLGLNAVQRPEFRDYELQKLAKESGVGGIPLQLIPPGASDETLAKYKEEFSAWLTGCGFREILEYYGLMLDHMHKHCLMVAQFRHFIDTLGDPAKLQRNFSRRLGVIDKHDELKSRFGIAPKFAEHMDTFYSARNALTHGLGIVRPEDTGDGGALRLCWNAMDVTVKGETSGSLIPLAKVLGVPLTEPSSMWLQFVERQSVFDVGSKVKLSSQDLYEICFFVSQQCIPNAIAAFAKFLKEQEIEE